MASWDSEFCGSYVVFAHFAVGPYTAAQHCTARARQSALCSRVVRLRVVLSLAWPGYLSSAPSSIPVEAVKQLQTNRSARDLRSRRRLTVEWIPKTWAAPTWSFLEDSQARSLTLSLSQSLSLSWEVPVVAHQLEGVFGERARTVDRNIS